MLRHTYACAARTRRLLGWCPMGYGYHPRTYVRTHMHTIHLCICPIHAYMHGMMQMYDACGAHVDTCMHGDMHTHTIHICTHIWMVRCRCMHGMMRMYDACGGRAHAHTHTHAHNPYMHMYSHTSMHTCMHGMMRMGDASHMYACVRRRLLGWCLVGAARGWCPMGGSCMHVVPHARMLLGWCPMGYGYHPRTRTRAHAHAPRACGACWAGAPCVMDIMHGYVPHARVHARAGGVPAPMHTQRGRERLLGWCLMGCGSCMHMHRMYTHARNIHMCMACSHMHMCNSHTCACVTHLETTQHVGAACMST